MGLFNFFKRSDDKDYRQIICDCCGKATSTSSNYCLTSSQVVTSHKYWDFVMTKPDIFEISRRHFLGDANATRARGSIIIPLFNSSTNWCICKDCIHFFDVNVDLARKYAIMKEKDPTFCPPNSGLPRSILDDQEFIESVSYATSQAGYDIFEKK